nr:hypothetical protein [Micromonospora sp. DSM 115978]
MLKEPWLRRLGLVSAVAAAGLATTPVAAHANDYDTPRSASAYGASTNYSEGMALAEARARAAVLAVGHDCTPGTYYTYVHTTSPYGSTWVWRSTHEAMCVD